MGVGGQHHARPLYLLERPGTHCTGGWVGPRAGLDGCGKSRPPPGFYPQTVTARSESLYRLSYPGPCLHNTVCDYSVIDGVCIALLSRLSWYRVCYEFQYSRLARLHRKKKSSFHVTVL